jgi:hypothetical protein
MMIMLAAGAMGQPLQLLDRFNGNAVVNDSTVVVFSSEAGIPELTQYFTMKNNTDRPLAVFLRKTVHQMSDSTTDYFCFGIKCWPGTDTTDIADTIPAGGVDHTFASHVCHIRRFDIPQPPLPLGKSVITYTVFDHTSFPEPVEASVTVIYHLSGLGTPETPQTELKVFPNPASDQITIGASSLDQGLYRLIVHNLIGLKVLDQDVLLSGSNPAIPVNHFKDGIYNGILTNRDGKSFRFRFVVKNRI